ncbi:MAG: ankyrin repeat domain-containing protein, partial [Firmicutes bacterium]|nr:ankyrin repeat domain-containing protein [Bacillota bacterium]
KISSEIFEELKNKKYSIKEITKATTERSRYWANNFNKCRNLIEFEMASLCSYLIELQQKMSNRTFSVLIRIFSDSNFLSYENSIILPLFIIILHFFKSKSLIDPRHGNSLLKSYLTLLIQKKSLKGFENILGSLEKFFPNENNDIRQLIETLNNKYLSKTEIKSEYHNANENLIVVKEEDKPKVILDAEESRMVNTHNFIEILNKGCISGDIPDDAFNNLINLLEKGVDINTKAKDEYTVLTYVIQRCDLSKLKILLNYENIKINLKELILAIDQNANCILKDLLRNTKEDVKKEKNKDECTLLMYAVSKEKINIDTVKTLLEDETIKASVNEQNKLKETVLTRIIKFWEEANIKIIIGELLKLKININHVDNDGTPLMLAAERGYEEVVNILSNDKNIELGYINKHKQTALDFAKNAEKIKIVILLLKKILEKMRTEQGFHHLSSSIDEVLNWAIAMNYEEIIKVLSDNIDLDFVKNCWAKALVFAVEKNQIGILAKLLEKKDVNLDFVFSKTNMTLLILGSKKDYKDVVERLLENGNIDVNAKDTYGKTALDYANDNKNETIVTLLKAKQAMTSEELKKLSEESQDEDFEDFKDFEEIEMKSKELILAIDQNNNDALKNLLKNTEEDVKKEKNEDECTLLMYAVSKEKINIDTVKTLLEDETIKASVNEQNKLKETVLTRIIKFWEEANIKIIIEELLKLKININHVDNDGTPLMLAAERGYEQVVNILLNHRDIELDCINKHGQTALHFAKNADKRKIVILLLEKIFEKIRTEQGFHKLIERDTYSIFNWAIDNNYEEIVKVFSNNTDLDFIKKYWPSALTFALDKGQTGMLIKLLEKKDLHLNFKCNEKKQTLLMLASKKGYKDVVVKLLENENIDLDVKDVYEKTALDYARKRENQGIIDLLEEEVEEEEFQDFQENEID